MLLYFKSFLQLKLSYLIHIFRSKPQEFSMQIKMMEIKA